MLILALETSSQAGSVALVECDHDRDNVLSQRVLRSDRRSAQSLAPAAAEVLAEAGRRATDVALVAVTAGPGSFTGLRVGVTMAKTFAYAVGCECLGLDTLETIAWQTAGTNPAGGLLHVVLDAQRKELYLARFCREAAGPVRLEENRIVSADEWLAGLVAGATVTGPGINRLIDRLPAGVIVAPEDQREPQAVTVGRLAWHEYQRGRRDDLWKLAPRYLRASAAEEKAAKL